MKESVLIHRSQNLLSVGPAPGALSALWAPLTCAYLPTASTTEGANIVQWADVGSLQLFDMVWILTGEARIEERDPGGPWIGHDVKAGDFFLVDSDTPYELRWQARSGRPFEVMHLYLGLALLERATAEFFGTPGRLMLTSTSITETLTLPAGSGLENHRWASSSNPARARRKVFQCYGSAST